MKYGFLKTLCAAAVAASAVLSCALESESTKEPVIEISCDREFTEDNSLELTLVVSASSKSDIVAVLGLAGSPVDITNLFPASRVVFPEKVIVPAGSPVASFKISVDPTGLADGTYTVGIAIASADGATISKDRSEIYVDFTVTGQGNSGNPGTTGLQANWTGVTDGEVLEYDGDYYVGFSLSVPGIKYFFAELNTPEDFDYYYEGSIEVMMSLYEEYIKEALEEDAIGDILYNESEASEIYVDYYGGGEQTLYILEFDAEGNATGRWGEVAVNLPEIDDGGDDDGGDDDGDDPLEVTLRLMDGWTIEYAGVWTEVVNGNSYDDEYFNVSGTGSTYYSICITDILDADDEDIIAMMQEDMEFWQGYAEIGYPYSSLLYHGEGMVDSLYEADAGTFDAYVVGYDTASGKPTGEYAVTRYTSTGISEGTLDDPTEAPARARAHARIRGARIPASR